MSEPAQPDAPDDPRPDDDEVHPSSLALLCVTREPPQPVEVLARLERAGFLPQELTEGPAAEGEAIVWSRAVQLAGGGTPWLLFCTRRDPQFTPWEWSNARWRSREEFEQTRGCRWVVFIETLYDDDHDPNEAYHRHLRVAEAAGEGLASACFDVQSLCFRSLTTLHELARCEVPPAPEQLFQVHVVGDENGPAWLHTHGLRRFDLPDLELLQVPRERTDDAHTALCWLTAYILHDYIPSAGCDVAFGVNIETRLKPLPAAADQLPADTPGTGADRDADHGGWRLALTDLAPAETSLCPTLLQQVQGDPIFWLSTEENDRRARLARARFGLAAAAFLSTQFEERHLAVKIGVPADSEGTNHQALLAAGEVPEGLNREHMWFTVLALRGKFVRGRLDNTPVYATYLAEGGEYDLPLSLLSGFTLRVDSQSYDPATITELDIVTLRTDRDHQ
ncbi:MAG: hypothetical protein IT463_13630 [Planctomycetes bacterium]|nr:hypothetical protein [Planctomycetota bacterium]